MDIPVKQLNTKSTQRNLYGTMEQVSEYAM
jgi:hypothetical protein